MKFVYTAFMAEVETQKKLRFSLTADGDKVHFHTGPEMAAAQGDEDLLGSGFASFDGKGFLFGMYSLKWGDKSLKSMSVVMKKLLKKADKEAKPSWAKYKIAKLKLKDQPDEVPGRPTKAIAPADQADAAIQPAAPVPQIVPDKPAPARPARGNLANEIDAELVRLNGSYELALQDYPFAAAKLKSLRQAIVDQIKTDVKGAQTALNEFEGFILTGVKGAHLKRELKALTHRLEQAEFKAGAFPNEFKKLQATHKQANAVLKSNPDEGLLHLQALHTLVDLILARPVADLNAELSKMTATLKEIMTNAPGAVAQLRKSEAAVLQALRNQDSPLATRLLDEYKREAEEVEAESSPEGIKRSLGNVLFTAKTENGQSILPTTGMTEPDVLKSIAAKTHQPVEKLRQLAAEYLQEVDRTTSALLPEGYKRPMMSQNTLNPLLAEETRPKLSAEEAKALQFYTSIYSQDGAVFNGPLRAKKQLEGDALAQYKQLKEAFKKAKPFKQPTEVLRGLEFKDPDKLEEFAKLFKVGEVTTLGGFMSTASGGVPKNFKDDIVLHIKAFHGLDTLPYTEVPQEKELMLDEPTRLKITKITRRGPKYDIYCEQVVN